MFEIALALAPLFLLVASLLLGHYPGLRTIVRIAERIHAGAGPRAAKSQPRPRAPRHGTVRGGLLIALGVATRPPPLAA
jgi:hypothetical protein